VRTSSSYDSTLSNLEEKLKSARTSDPRLEADLILSEAVGKTCLEILLDKKQRISSEQSRKINSMLARRLKHEPLQYIFGKAYFRNLILKVGPGVLVPRPETEILVEHALKLAPENSHVLDIATGSGAIAISLAQERPDLMVNASDISRTALGYARRNMKLNKVGKIKFWKADLLKGIRKRKKFSVITANLPYINAKDYAALPREIRKYEPKSALLSGKDGLNLIRKLILTAPENLENGGHLILEISPEQERKIICFFDKSKKFSSIEFKKDLCGKIRFCIIKKKMKHRRPACVLKHRYVTPAKGM